MDNNMLKFPAPDRRSVFIVDDHPLMRESLAALLDRQPGLRVCGQAGDSATAYPEIERLQPEIVVVDLSLPLDLFRRLKLRGQSRLELAEAHVMQARRVHVVAGDASTGRVTQLDRTIDRPAAVRRVVDGNEYFPWEHGFALGRAWVVSDANVANCRVVDESVRVQAAQQRARTNTRECRRP